MEESASPVRLRCLGCSATIFLNPKVGAALLVQDGERVLLARRREAPFKGWWTLPAGYVEYEETCEEAARREGLEELRTPVTLEGLHAVVAYRDDPRSRMVLVVFRASCDLSAIRPGDDVDECRFFKLDELPDRIAFSGNVEVLEGLRRGRRR